MSVFMVGLSPGINTIGKALSLPFSYQLTDDGIIFTHQGKTSWEIIPSMFGGSPSVLIEERPNELRLHLKNAYYPGTKIRADFQASIKPEDRGWQMEISYPGFTSTQKIKFTEWLSGKSVIDGKTGPPQCYRLNQTDSLNIPSSSPVTIDHSWQISIKPPTKITFYVLGQPEKFGELILSLKNPITEFQPEIIKATCFELRGPEGIFQSVESLLYHEKPVFLNHQYPFSFTSLIFSEAEEKQIRTLWACNESGSESHTRFLATGNGSGSLALFQNRLYKEYGSGNSPFIYTADLGDSPQWIGTAGTSFAIKGSPDHRFIVSGNDNKADYLECRALVSSSRIRVLGGSSIPVDYKNAPEILVVPQDPVKVKPRNIKQGEVLTPGKILEEAPDDDSRANWIYVNQEAVKVKFKVDKPILFNVIRPEDFINLQFEFVNFNLEDNLLKIDDKKEPAFLIVHFPSQHTREEVMRDISSSGVASFLKKGNSDGPTGLHAPVKFLRAKSSRLVYRIPADYNFIPVTLDHLLNWKDFDLQVNYRARWFNQVSNISLIKTQLQASSMAYSKKTPASGMQLSTPNVNYQSKQVKAVDAGKATVVSMQKPQSVQEIKVNMATTPKGSGVMALSDEQFSGLLALPVVEQINFEKLQGVMKKLLAMKEPSKYETMIEVPAYLQISPNQFAAFQHFTDLRDAAGTYDPAEAGLINTDDEATAVSPSKPALSNKKQAKTSLSKAQTSNINFFRNVVIGSTASPKYKGIVSSQLMKMPVAITLPKGNLFELWHTRLGIKLASGEIDEDVLNQLKTIRVLWSEFANEDYAETKNIPETDSYFYSLPNPQQMHQLVHLTSNYLDLYKEENGQKTKKKYTPRPVRADRLMLSALGSWIDFKLNIPEDVAGLSIKAWLQRATMGRDHYIKIVERGNLFPFGHKALLIVIAERRIRTINNVNTAVLIQREFIIVKQPELFYGKQQGSADFIPFPFQRVEIKDIETEVFTQNVQAGSKTLGKELYKPDGSGKPNYFRMDIDDASGKTVRMEVPLVWVSAVVIDDSPELIGHYEKTSWDYFTSDAPNKPVSYARSLVPGDTTFETAGIIFKAREFPKSENGSNFYPEVLESSIYIRQLEELTGKRSPVRIRLLDDNNLSMVFAEFIDDEKPGLTFDNTEKGGGFLAPNMNLTGLSKLTGLVGNKLDDLEKVLLSVQDVFAMADNLMPKLFGVIKFVDLLTGTVDLTPAIHSIKSAIENIRSQIEDLQQELLSIMARIDNEVKKLDKLIGVIGNLLNETDIVGALQDTQKLAQAFATYGISIEGDAVTALNAVVVLGKEIQDKGIELNNIYDFVSDAEGFKNKLKEAGITITDQIGQAADQTLKVVKALHDKGFSDTEIIGTIGGLGLASQLSDIQELIKNLATQAASKVLEAIPEIPNVKFQIKGNEIVVEYHWKPKTKNSYTAADIFTIQNLNTAKSQVDVSIDSVMTKTLDLNSSPKFDVNASINDFGIIIIDTIQLNFKQIAFKAGMSSKSDVDVKFQSVPIRLVGSLSFVNGLQSVVKSDQFSSGPFINVTGTGIEAGYNFPIPNVAVGIFSMTNMTLGTKLTLPLNRDPLKLGFNFCTRENPFNLMVSCFGGGGFFAIVTTMHGLTQLEAAFEFGAGISLDVGVASGSVSVMGGIYYSMTLGDEDHISYELAAYLRLTGRLSIIGLIKVTLEFYLELAYESGAEKKEVDGIKLYKGSQLIGTAILSVKVEVLFFSKKVSVTVRRTLAGNDGDPTFAQTYYLEDWQNYCSAFAS